MVVESGSRCARHAKMYQESRRAPASVRYGPGYRARRAEVLRPDADGSPKLCELRLPGCTGVATTADHVTPVSLGGRDSVLVPACSHCNSSRGNRTIAFNVAPGHGSDSRVTRVAPVQDPGASTLMPDGSVREERLATWKGKNH